MSDSKTACDEAITVWAVERGEYDNRRVYDDRRVVALFCDPSDAVAYVLDNQNDWTPENNVPGFERYFVSAYPLFTRPVSRTENLPDMNDYEPQLTVAYATLPNR